MIIGTNLSAASYDCNKAVAHIDKQICNNQTISQLDGEMGIIYKSITDNLSGDELATFKNEGRKWIKERNKCRNDQCLIDKYKNRIIILTNIESQLISANYMGFDKVKQFLITTIAEVPRQAGYYKVAATELNVRSKPSKKGKILSAVKNGETVLVSEFIGKWAKTDIGWISGKYLKKINQKKSTSHSSPNSIDIQSNNSPNGSIKNSQASKIWEPIAFIIVLLIIAIVSFILKNLFIKVSIALKLAEPDRRSKSGIRLTSLGKFVQGISGLLVILLILLIASSLE